MLGLNLSRILRAEDSVTLVTNRRSVDFSGVNIVKFDAFSQDFESKLETMKPDLVISAAAETSIESCESDYFSAYLANVQVNSEIARACASVGVQNIFISTDHIFNNPKGNSSEYANVKLVNNYAKTKYGAEHRILLHDPNALVIRTNFFAWGPRYRASFVDRLLASLKNGEKVSLFDDVFFTPIHVSDLWQGVEQALRAEMNGVVHLGGGERLSKYEFGLRLCQSWGQDHSLIRRGTIDSRKDLVSRPRDMSLHNGRMEFDSIWRPKALSEQINALNSDLSSGWYRELNEIRFSDMNFKDELPYSRQHVTESDIDAVCSTLRSGPLTQGPRISNFENQICRYTGAKYAVAVSSATAGLHIAYCAAGLNQQGTLLTTPNSFVSTANAAIFLGASVAFADVSPETASLSIQGVENYLEKGSTADLIVPVHFGGQPSDLEKLRKVTRSRGIPLIEDAAHSLGATYPNGEKVGSCCYSDATVFSMHPVKSITSGEGGIVTTNDRDFYKSLIRLRSHGINKLDDEFINIDYAYTHGVKNEWYYEMQELGYHYRLTDLQAALASSQLDKIDFFMESRRSAAHDYVRLIEGLGLPSLRFLGSTDKSLSANHLFVLLIDFEATSLTRTKLMAKLKKKGIQTQVHYIPIPMHPFYRSRGFTMSDLPNTSLYYAQALSIPLFVGISHKQRSFIVKSLVEDLHLH